MVQVLILFLVFAPFTALAGTADGQGADGSVPPQGEPKVEESFMRPDEVEALGIETGTTNPATTSAPAEIQVGSSSGSETEPGADEPEYLLVKTEEIPPTNEPQGSFPIEYLLGGVGALIALIVGVYAAYSSKKPKEPTNACELEKSALNATQAEIDGLGAEINLLESLINELKGKAEDVLKGKADALVTRIAESLKKHPGVRLRAGSTILGAQTGIHAALSAKDAFDSAVELVENLKRLLAAAESAKSAKQLLYDACVKKSAVGVASGGASLIVSGNMKKVLLVDAMGALVYEESGVYEPLQKLIDSYPNRKIVLTMAPDELMEKWGLTKLPFEVHTSRLNPKKSDPAYYKDMLKKFNLEASNTVYFEHSKEAVDSAQSVGIKSYYYDGQAKDIATLKKFLDKELSN